MIKKDLNIEGRFVEAFFYFDFLWLISEDGSTWAFDIQRYMTDKLGDQAETAISVFARNDRLQAGAPVVSSKHPLSPLILQFLAAGSIDVRAGELEAYSTIFATKLQHNSILDFRCYYSRAFVATDTNIIQFNVYGRNELNHFGVGARGNGRLGGSIVHDARCLRFKTQFGVLSASCGLDGGWYAAGLESTDPGWKPNFLRFTETSFNSEFVADSVATIKGGNLIELHGTVKDVRVNTDAREGQGDEADDLQSFIREVKGIDVAQTDGLNLSIAKLGASAITVCRTFLSKSVLFVADTDNRITSIRIASHSKLVPPKINRPFKEAPGRIVGMSFTPVGLVAELDESCHLLSENAWHEIFPEPVYSIRGYPSSQWYRNLVSAVGEDWSRVSFIT